jgi:hypothetical protein
VTLPIAYRSGLCFPNCPGDAIKAGLKRITADAFLPSGSAEPGIKARFAILQVEPELAF